MSFPKWFVVILPVKRAPLLDNFRRKKRSAFNVRNHKLLLHAARTFASFWKLLITREKLLQQIFSCHLLKLHLSRSARVDSLSECNRWMKNFFVHHQRGLHCFFPYQLFLKCIYSLNVDLFLCVYDPSDLIFEKSKRDSGWSSPNIFFFEKKSEYIDLYIKSNYIYIYIFIFLYYSKTNVFILHFIFKIRQARTSWKKK